MHSVCFIVKKAGNASGVNFLLTRHWHRPVIVSQNRAFFKDAMQTRKKQGKNAFTTPASIEEKQGHVP